jgi:DNA-directed RNA polymerase sigma subunit (sigma70/sigma32)
MDTLTALRSSDAQLYDEWKKATGFAKQQKLQRLLEQLGGAIATAVRVYQTAPLPYAIVQAEGTRLAVEALDHWEPSRGLSLASYVLTSVKQRLNRYVIEHQNFARIPEEKVRLIGPMREAEAELSSRFGREPTVDEVADHMAIPVAHVSRLRKMMRADILESSADFSSVEQFTHDADYDRVMLAYYSLTADEKLMFDYSLGAHGKPKLSPGEIATKLGLTSVRVSQLKKQLADKLSAYVR